jgi:ABC-type phosphate transport system substrate-binding protein
MSLVPTFQLGFWNAWLFVLPYLLVIYGLSFLIGNRKAALFTFSDYPATKNKTMPVSALLLLLIIYSIFLPLQLGTMWFFIGLVVYLLGMLLVLWVIFNPAYTLPDEPMTSMGILRRPVWFGTIAVFAGTGIAAASWLFLGLGILLSIWQILRGNILPTGRELDWELVTSERGAELERGRLRLTIAPGVFDDDSIVRIVGVSEAGLDHVDNAFRITSTIASDKLVEISILLDIDAYGYEHGVAYVEIKEDGENHSYLVAGRLQERLSGSRKLYYVTVYSALFKEKNAVIGGGILVPWPEEWSNLDPSVRPVPHQFKIPENDMQRDEHGNTRRRKDGEEVDTRPQDIYPACYPAAWASLCSAYHIALKNPRRRWGLGTPIDDNPDSDPEGDYFSTWSVGGGDELRKTARVVEGRLDESEIEKIQPWFRFEDGPVTEGRITRRANLIRLYLLTIVGDLLTTGNRPPTLRKGQPVVMGHEKHAWVIVDVDDMYYWSHGQNNTAWAFSDQCNWQNARWVPTSETIKKSGNSQKGFDDVVVTDTDTAKFDIGNDSRDIIAKSDAGELLEYDVSGSSEANTSIDPNDGVYYLRPKSSASDRTNVYKVTCIARDGIAIIVHPDLDVNNLSRDEVRKIFAGEAGYRNWSTVGGPDKPIKVVTREAGSGTRDAFEKVVMKDNSGGPVAIRVDANEQITTGAVWITVAETPNAIGYVSLGFLHDKPEIVKTVAIDGFRPTVGNIRREDYPFDRPLNMITKVDPSAPNDPNVPREPLPDDFLDFVCSNEGQGIVDAAGYVPLAGYSPVIVDGPPGVPSEWQPEEWLSGDLTLGGSTSVEPLANKLARVFEEKCPDRLVNEETIPGVTVDVQGALQPLSEWWIAYPKDCELKSEDRRLGSIAFIGSGDLFKCMRFVDVNHPSILDEAVDIHWTPHTGIGDNESSDNPGYYWIESKVLLNEYGRPQERQSHLWNKDLGRHIPQPANDSEDCECKNPNSGEYNPNEDGCGKCRLRLMLPFWVHNTTRNEELTYRVDVEFWTKDQEWENINHRAKQGQALKDEDDNVYYDGFRHFKENGWDKRVPGLPGNPPGSEFTIKAKDDPKPDNTGRDRETWNSAPFATYIDFYKDDLTPGEVHGIRLKLTCIKRETVSVGKVQDVKQFWFYVTNAAD